uniref:DDE Tnp4 domain-containing protein n=1 Tax=Chenopodium quinoa TaxID=63459 RepID=A0A803MKL7_CHEQI
MFKLGKYYIKQADHTTSYADDNKWKWFEGFASDPPVLRDALRRPNGLKVPKNKYLLVDLGYSNAEGFLAPYKENMEETSLMQEVDHDLINMEAIDEEEINEGNKGDGELKSQAYQALVDNVRKHLGILVTMDQVNRIKRSGRYKNKCIENWDDICTLFAPDRAIGDGAEQHEEAAAAMENENDNASTSETASGDSNKRLKRDRLADAVSSFAQSFKEYVSKSTRPTSQEIYKEVSSVLEISRHQALRAVKRFLNGTFEEFDMLKNLPDDQKLDWIILCIDE